MAVGILSTNLKKKSKTVSFFLNGKRFIPFPLMLIAIKRTFFAASLREGVKKPVDADQSAKFWPPPPGFLWTTILVLKEKYKYLKNIYWEKKVFNGFPCKYFTKYLAYFSVSERYAYFFYFFLVADKGLTAPLRLWTCPNFFCLFLDAFPHLKQEQKAVFVRTL